ncbi:sugar ABC transporter substrate-binding protein [Paracoccus denitrificans]|uniref:Monosaccharide ABC transporter substrate-binding protein, CUT2 family n=1 Tax=Paracoccus denitrificans (strain Pd 1222) TaxID=318586 RepID=A1B2N4_PARDP|nr:sugar ABC transporter substrate-binding protein [Paracoccus denitrificans]ABL69778.1 monosaccharide ABC transporter substrate-binding protein, CUT2 family [Paracoccus denitrificans PD1222]MBB4629484.1 ribose transport system substrate-binding protein [Paracoccus denitrificans]MCU7430732.1 sugar ABC transporter substrate-binding protein [Paracoccus denitrificans]UPV94060.1 sugar ABC transporter substrate-binding protein [Paracoccus denitrificans]WQO33900.1 sugar ABC transporter substrate-bin
MKGLTAMALVLGLSAPALAGGTRIGVSMTSFDNPFLTILLNGIKQQAAQDGAELILEDAQLDVARQQNQVQNFIANGVDAIIVNAVDGAATPAMTQMAIQAGVPLVYVNHPPIGHEALPKGTSFVGSDEVESGTMQTREVCRMLGGKGNVMVLMGPLENEASAIRTRDIEEVIATPECSGMTIVDRQVGNWNRTQGQDITTNWLSSGIAFDAIISNNDEMAIGAIQSLKAAGVAMDKVVVAGIDATPDGLSAMRAGDLDVTVYQNATRQGEVAVQTAIAMAGGETPERNIWVPFEPVTPENLSNYE